MKNVVLIGASGFVGTAILNELLNRGHKVTAIVRDLAKVTASNPNLKVVQADVTDTDVLILSWAPLRHSPRENGCA